MNSSTITAREMRSEELEQGLAVRNRIFSPITVEDWSRGDAKTAVIAFDGEEAVGFIPLYFREFRLVPGVTVNAAFENAVGTSEAYRGRGVGSMMIEAACRFLPSQADALFLYRSDERSAGYRFYTKTGHADLHYVRLLVRENGLPTSHLSSPDVRIFAGTDELTARQPELLELFEETYSAYGGFPQRGLGYWAHALSSPIYAAHPADFYYAELREAGKLTGYAIAGKNKRDGERGPLKVLEIASSEGCKDRARSVLQGVCAFSEQSGFASTLMHVGHAHPFAELLPDLGFEPKRRSMQIMAHCFDPRVLFERTWRSRLQLPGIRLHVWTPRNDVTLLDGGDETAQTVTLEMKEDTFTAWMLGRIRLRDRIREGTITMLNGNDRILNELARAIPHADWVYHHLDYV